MILDSNQTPVTLCFISSPESSVPTSLIRSVESRILGSLISNETAFIRTLAMILKLILLSSLLVVTAGPAFAQEEATPGFNTPIPKSIMTSDEVETSIGTLEFFDGMPTAKTVDAVYDNLDRIRGTEVFLNFIPAASLEGMRLGMESMPSFLPGS